MKFFIILGIFSFCTKINIATASETLIFDNFSPCQWYSQTEQKKLNTEQKTICEQDRNTELFAEYLEKESEAFQKNIFDLMNADNGSNPNWIAEKGILELRKNHQCLSKICHDIFEFCSRPQNSSDWTLESERWCTNRVQNLDEIGKTKLYAIANGNQARKDRSLLKEKHRAIDTRFNAYFQHWMPQVVNGLQNFTDKVTIFIMFPF